MPNHQNSQKVQERNDILRFIRLLPGCPDDPDLADNPNEPPDFIWKTAGREIGIEHTTVAASDKWYTEDKYWNHFDRYLCEVAKNWPFKLFPMPAESTSEVWKDLYNHRESAVKWIEDYGKKTPLPPYSIREFGKCCIRLEDHGSYIAAWLNWSNPYLVTEQMYEKLAAQIWKGVEKKIKIYAARNIAKIDILLVVPKFSEPIFEPFINSDLEKIGCIIISRFDNFLMNDMPSIDLVPRYFKEIWVLMCDRIFRIFPTA